MRVLVFRYLLAIIFLPAVIAANPIGVGVYGGGLIPVAQDDQGSGYLFGLKIRANLPGPFAFEPNINIGSFGEANVEGAGLRDGSSFKHYGIDFVLGGGMASIGIKPYLFIGGAIYNTKRDGDNTTNKSGWSTGGGLALGIMEKMDIDIRTRLSIASSETKTGSASKKAVGITAGVVYYLGQLQGGGK